MPTTQQTIATNDGTKIVVDSWLETEDTMVMRPGSTNFTASCPEHGELGMENGYISILVSFAVRDHANDFHDGLVDEEGAFDIGPAIQL